MLLRAYRRVYFLCRATPLKNLIPPFVRRDAVSATNEKYNRECYTEAYTNASLIVREDGFDDGLFTGYDADKRQYDKTSWHYELDETVLPNAIRDTATPAVALESVETAWAPRRHGEDLVVMPARLLCVRVHCRNQRKRAVNRAVNLVSRWGLDGIPSARRTSVLHGNDPAAR